MSKQSSQNSLTDTQLAAVKCLLPELTAFLKELAIIPAPTFHEDLRREFLIRSMKQHNFPAPETDCAGNIILPFFPDNKSPAVLFSAHLDTVFLDQEILLKQNRNILTGPGIVDDTANTAVLYFCLRYLAEQKAIPKDNIIFAFNTCEEGLGNLKGMRQIFNRYASRIKAAVAFDLDYESICTKSVGSKRYQITANTKGGHSYLDFGHENAIEKLSALIQKLCGIPIPQGSGKSSYNVGQIWGGTSVNTIAQTAGMLFEFRSDEKKSLETMEQHFLSIINDAAEPEVSYSVTQLGDRPCMEYVPEPAMEQLTKLCTNAVYQATGTRPRPISSSTDANIPLSIGIPAVSFGCCRGGGYHTNEEWIDLDSLNAGFCLAASLIWPHFTFDSHEH